MKRIVKRKWGFYITLIARERFKVKLLRFRAGEKCSHQYHEHRNELWLILKGFGSMKLAGTIGDIKAGEYCLVPISMQHKFIAINPTWVLEIQYGDLCEEEDIVRI